MRTENMITQVKIIFQQLVPSTYVRNVWRGKRKKEQLYYDTRALKGYVFFWNCIN